MISKLCVLAINLTIPKEKNKLIKHLTTIKEITPIMLNLHRIKKYKLLISIVAIILAILIILIAIHVIGSNNEKNNKSNNKNNTLTTDKSSTDKEKETETEAEDPENSTNTNKNPVGTTVDIPALLASNNVSEIANVTYGIDVSKYQGTIDWKQVKESGIDFAMIRVGYRTQNTGVIIADANAQFNMQQATANEIKIGVYFFSSAITAAEAIEEADWVAQYIAKYQITYPVAFNCEGFDYSDHRQNTLSQSLRTDLAIAFLNQIYTKGYTPMFYASKNELTANAKWDTSRLDSTYKIWVSQYPSVPYPQKATSDYTGTHAMWQYTNQGTIPGISSPVDVNIAYFGYDTSANSVDNEIPEIVAPDKEALMKFTDVNETITAKDSTNLRDLPSQGSDSKIIATLTNGIHATRTGISSSGWSRIVYNGTIYYAISSFLTTDLESSPSTNPTDGSASGDGLKTVFTELNDIVTPKIEVNLRLLPSVTNPDATIIATIPNGIQVTRTGINHDFGWSRVIYNGKVLYCVSSYLTDIN